MVESIGAYGLNPKNDPLTQQIAAQMLAQSGALQGTGLEQLLGSVNTHDVFTTKGGMKVDLTGQPAVGATAFTGGPPSAAYSQNAAKVQGTFYMPLTQVGSIKWKGQKGKGKSPFTGKNLADSLNKSLNSRNPSDKARAERFMKDNDIIKGVNGEFLVAGELSRVQSAQGAGTVASSAAGMTAANNPIGSSVTNLLTRSSSFLPVMGLMGNGLGGLAGALVASKALGSSSSGLTSGLVGTAVGAGGLGSLGTLLSGASLGTASPSSYYGSALGVVGNGTAATVAQMAGLPGLAFDLRKQMNEQKEIFNDQSLINEINDPGVPIEDLIYMFMARMSQNYEQKLRDKMQETAIADQRETQRTQEQDNARMLGGIASIIPGVGPLIGQGIQAATNQKIQVQDALNGSQKSSTLLMQEVQVLMQKWKQVTELSSNLSKTLNDMTMTPIRNLR